MLAKQNDADQDGRCTALRLSALVCVAMLCFAGNSILCRLALKGAHIDPASFTLLRMSSGAAMLYILLGVTGAGAPVRGSWRGAFALILYAITFSFAYVRMEAGTGALLLFGAVQLSMILYGMLKGERLSLAGTAGLLLGISGLVYLLLPGGSAPPLGSAALMIVAGASWGWYSILGKGVADPLAETTGNFLRAVPFALACALPFLAVLNTDLEGAMYAVLSGAVASGMGYALWYGAMRELSVLKASTVQLSVPVISVLAGIALLDEILTLRIVAACALVLGGIAIVLVSRQRRAA
ncbi:EamA family transporter [Pusillimonas sp. TS35]|uniref:DMT family transporter n=1 Tax=Paracandidimonas lactea TaxID=2895524 RepID=UPI00136C0C07|nr:DMT family transporter [Paracandidimonas lactea]MYN13554.1 EamA family transporter [Pusillimonas sp. TS35]